MLIRPRPPRFSRPGLPPSTTAVSLRFGKPIPGFAIVAAAWLASVPAWADWKASIDFASDYVYRGYSKSRGNPVMQGNVDYGHESGWYGGLWTSMVSYDDPHHTGDPAEVEITPYLGWAGQVAEDWRGEVSSIGYLYAGQWYGRNVDYAEFTAALHFRDLVSARFAAAPDAYGWNAPSYAYELAGRYSLLDNLQFSAGAGFQQAPELIGYNYFYGNAGLTWFLNRHVALDLRYVGSNYSSHGPEYAEEYFSPRPLARHYVFTVTVGF